jgi:serine/threonine protein kinase
VSGEAPECASELQVLARELLSHPDKLDPAEMLPVLFFDQRARWQAGERLPAEAYLRMLAGIPNGAQCAFELIYNEFTLREELGEAPDLEEYLRRFPAHAAQLRRQVELHRVLAGSAPRPAPHAAPDEPTQSLRPPAVAPPPLPHLPGYEVLEVLGEGGMGTVYKARHCLLDRLVALKVVHRDRLHCPEAVARFRRETLAVARLTHPNFVTVHDAGQLGDRQYLAMEYLDGIDLERLLEQNGPLPIELVRDFALQVARGLAHAHERGLVHRDIKPANLIVVPRPPAWNADPAELAPGRFTVKILDMGLARFDSAQSNLASLTMPGTLVGTPNFVAPEQILDPHQADIRADLYSLGCTLYFLLCGRVPFNGRTVIETLDMHRWLTPRPVQRFRPDTPAWLAELVRKLMAKRPEDRFQTPAELCAALTHPSPGEEPAARPARPRRAAPPPPDITPLKLRLAEKLEKNQFFQASLLVAQLLELDPNDSDALAAQEFLAQTRPSQTHACLEGHGDEVTSIACLPDGRRVLSGSRDQTIRLWDVVSGQELRCLRGHAGAVLAVAVSADGRFALSGGDDRLVHLWDLESGWELRRFKAYHGPVCSLAFSADGRWALSGHQKNLVHLWEISTGKGLRELKGHHGEVTAVAFSPRTARAFSASHDGTARVWNLHDGREICSFRKPSVRILSLAIAPSEDWAVFGCANHLAHVWDIRSEQERLLLRGHRQEVASVAVSPDGRHILTGSRDSTIRLWSSDTGQELLRLYGHAADVLGVIFRPGGQAAVSAGKDRTIRVWSLT